MGNIEKRWVADFFLSKYAGLPENMTEKTCQPPPPS